MEEDETPAGPELLVGSMGPIEDLHREPDGTIVLKVRYDEPGDLLATVVGWAMVAWIGSLAGQAGAKAYRVTRRRLLNRREPVDPASR